MGQSPAQGEGRPEPHGHSGCTLTWTGMGGRVFSAPRELAGAPGVRLTECRDQGPVRGHGQGWAASRIVRSPAGRVSTSWLGSRRWHWGRWHRGWPRCGEQVQQGLTDGLWSPLTPLGLRAAAPRPPPPGAQGRAEGVRSHSRRLGSGGPFSGPCTRWKRRHGGCGSGVRAGPAAACGFARGPDASGPVRGPAPAQLQGTMTMTELSRGGRARGPDKPRPVRGGFLKSQSHKEPLSSPSSLVSPYDNTTATGPGQRGRRSSSGSGQPGLRQLRSQDPARGATETLPGHPCPEDEKSVPGPPAPSGPSDSGTHGAHGPLRLGRRPPPPGDLQDAQPSIRQPRLCCLGATFKPHQPAATDGTEGPPRGAGGPGSIPDRTGQLPPPS